MSDATYLKIDLGKYIADHLYNSDTLPDGSFVTDYVVVARVASLNGTNEATWFTNHGFSEAAQAELLREVVTDLDE